MDSPLFVDTKAGLAEVSGLLSKSKVLGVDTESNTFYSYNGRICLLQVSTGKKDVLIDTLELDDFECLEEIFADPGVIKVFHDGEQDVWGIKKYLNLEVKGVFDTKIAASALGHGSLGLALLVSRYLGIKLDKRMQRSNWGQRPLKPEQIRYASNDTKYLIPLYEKLLAELEAKNGLAYILARQEFRRIERSLSTENKRLDPGFLNIKGAAELDAKALRYLAELYLQREKVAKERDMPPGRIVSDFALLVLARRGVPTSVHAMEKEAGLKKGTLRKHKEWIFRTLKQASLKSPIFLEKREHEKKRGRPGPAQEGASRKLKAWRKRLARRENMDSFLVLRNKVIQHIVNAMPCSMEELLSVPGVEKWWAELFGEEIIEIVLSAKSAEQS